MKTIRPLAGWLAAAVFLAVVCQAWVAPALAGQPIVHINADMEAEPVATNCLVIRSFHHVPSYGRIPGNELLYIAGREGLLVNTPWDCRQTEQLVDWAASALKVTVVKAILTHTHDDCMGGIAALTNRHIQTIALDLTAQKARRERKPVPETLFSEEMQVTVGNRQVEAFYPGAGHATDNIVVWLASEKILFGGCLVKSAESRDLGNIADADLHAWPGSLRRLRARYPAAELVIPGHGNAAGPNCIAHTLELLQQAGMK